MFAEASTTQAAMYVKAYETDVNNNIVSTIYDGSDKPISIDTRAALDLKANLASPTFTGTVSGITKTMVGLGNVDNTTDANKPVSTATQTALNLKSSSSKKATT
jgi:hypothetical protein